MCSQHMVNEYQNMDTTNIGKREMNSVVEGLRDELKM